MKAIDSQESGGARLRDARIAAGYKTAADAARAIGLRPVTVRAHESGQNGFPAAVLDLYTKHYGVSPQYLLFGRHVAGDPSPPLTNPAPQTAYAEIAAELARVRGELARAQGRIAYLKDGLRKLLEGLS